MTKEFTPASVQRRAFYEQNYDVLAHIELPPGERKYIGNRQNRICRYCGKTSSSTTFKNIAHTFPQFIGNKTLVSHDECDHCNAKFSNSIDVHLARYLGIETTIAKVPGKKGVPTYRVQGKTPRIEYSIEENMLKANAHIDDGFLEIDENRKEVKFTAFRQPYQKRSAFKCLTKMALAIMPEDELINFKQTLDWVNSDDDKLTTDALYCLRSRSIKSLHAIDAVLLKRISNAGCIPYATFFIAFYNFTFQIFLPLCSQDVGLNKIQVCHFPNKMEYFSEVTYYHENLSPNETVRNEKDVQFFSYNGDIIKTFIGTSLLEGGSLPTENN